MKYEITKMLKFFLICYGLMPKHNSLWNSEGDGDWIKTVFVLYKQY